MIVRWLAVATGFLYVSGVIFPVPASAVTAELARTCRSLTAKQFPPRQPANPAAGSAKGSGRDQLTYYEKCVANQGKVDNGGNQ